MKKRFVVVLALMSLVVTACGSEATESPTSAGEAGSDLPTRRAGEPYGYSAALVSGVLTDGGDCWVVDLGDGPRPVVFPAGFEAGGEGEVRNDEAVLRSGMAVDGTGGLVRFGELPTRADGSLDALDGCVTNARHAVVFEDIEPSFDPAVLTDEDWVALVESAELTKSWDCGIGFAVSTEDQRVALVVHATTTDDPVDRVVELPDDRWSAQVQVGKHLMTQWCDDSIELWESTPTVSGTWQITAGTLDFGAGELPGTECDGTVTAGLSGIRVETPEGEIALDDLQLVNEAFGCFAG